MTTPAPNNIVDQELIVKHTGRQYQGRALYELVQPLTFNHKVNGGGLTIEVPKGFITDFASIPKVFWPIFPPAGQYAKAAVIHDYLYRLTGCSRFLADAIFREVMAQLGVPFWKRCAMYYAVRFFGRGHNKIPEGKSLLDAFD